MSKIKWMTRYDISKLGTKSDTDLGKDWNLSKERIRQFRKALNIKKFKKIPKNEIILINYLKTNDKPISIKEISHATNVKSIDKKKLNDKYLKRIAEKNNIDLELIHEQIFDHGYKKYVYKCRCEICRLANTIYCGKKRLNKSFGRKFAPKDATYYANIYIDLYKLDKTQYRKLFYEFIEHDFIIRSGTCH